MKGKDKLKQVDWRWWKIAGGAGLLALGIFLAVFGNYGRQILIIMPGIFLTIAGGFLLYSGWREGSLRILKKGEPDANSLVIRANSVGFEHIADAEGMQRRCANDGGWYHLLVEDKNKGLVEYELPDATGERLYYDPRELANVITMPANKKLFEPLPSLFQKVAVGIMGLVVVALGIVIVAMSG